MWLKAEARLRHELEEKGLFLLSVHGRGALKIGQFRLRIPRRHRVSSAAFLIFNQELATLLKAGLPLVQSLDILRRRVENPTFKAALDDVYDKVRSGTALSEAFEAQHLFSGVYTASLMAGEKSGSLEQVLRRYVQHVKVLASVRRRVVSALIYPIVLVLLSLSVVGLIVFKVDPTVQGVLRRSRARPRPAVFHPRGRGDLHGVDRQLLADPGNACRAHRAGGPDVPPAGAAQAAARVDPAPAVLRPAGAEGGDRPGLPYAGDAPVGRHSARERARDRLDRDWQSRHFGRPHGRRAPGPGRQQPGRVALRAPHVSQRRGRDGGSGGVDRRAGRDAQQRRRFL